jgi:benzaldehyde dehydrogenase (NAD)
MSSAAATEATALLDPAVWEGRLFLGGWTAGGGGTAAVVEAATGTELAQAGLADVADVAQACSRAAAAQAGWAATSFEERAAVMRRAAELLHAASDEVSEWVVRESGATWAKAGAELHGTIAELHEAAGLPAQATGRILPTRVPGRTSVARRVPLGVVAAIAPWNAPLVLAMRTVAPALALGNAVVLKPDPRTAVSGGVVLARAFELAGLPADLLQVVPGGPAVGEALVRDPHVAMISFTGSTAVGRRVGAIAGEQLKRSVLELGGNNAFVVLADADVDVASSQGAWCAYLHQGQICMSAGRHLVHRSLAPAYAEALTRRAAALRVGDPFTDRTVQVGPIIDRGQLDRIARIVDESVAAGAELLTGGQRGEHHYPPTVLSGVTPDMPAFEQEIFGPVAPITVFDDDDEAVELVRRTGYGLVAGIACGSAARGLALGERLGTGIVHVNDHTVYSEAHSPFGGTGLSGNGGAFGGEANWEELTRWQWITVRDQGRPTAF